MNNLHFISLKHNELTKRVNRSKKVEKVSRRSIFDLLRTMNVETKRNTQSTGLKKEPTKIMESVNREDRSIIKYFRIE